MYCSVNVGRQRNVGTKINCILTVLKGGRHPWVRSNRGLRGNLFDPYEYASGRKPNPLL